MCIYATQYLLRQIKFKVTQSELKEVLESNPFYPSLRAIRETLEYYEIRNKTVKVDPKLIEKYPVPFISQIESVKEKFVVVKSINGKLVEYFNSNNRKVEFISLADFLQWWSGILMYAELGSKRTAKNYNRRYFGDVILRMLKVLLIILVFVIINNLVQSTNNFGVEGRILLWFLIVNKIIGLLMSFNLLAFIQVKSNRLFQRMCLNDFKAPCSDTLLSNYSKILGILPLSDLSLFYSLIGVYFITQIDRSNVGIIGLAWMNLLTLPVLGYSVFTQLSFIKRWCNVCFTMQIQLVIEFAILYRIYWTKVADYKFSLSTMSQACLLLLVGATVLAIIKFNKYYAKYVSNKLNIKTANLLIYNPAVFNALLDGERIYPKEDEAQGILLGNLNSNICITQILSPYCEPCGEVLLELTRLIINNKMIKLQIVFLSGESYDSQPSRPIIKFLTIGEEKGADFLAKALEDWYTVSYMNCEKYEKKYRSSKVTDSSIAKYVEMIKWCQKMKIRRSPMTYINGMLLPDIYNYRDLKNIL